MWVVLGEVVQVALDLDQGPLDARFRRMGARRLLTEPRRVLVGRSVDERGRLHDDVPHGAVGRARGGEEIHRADHVDLVQRPAAHVGGVHDQERVQDGVDLRRLHDAGQDRVALVGAHELGALERHRRRAGVEAHDDVDAGVALERLRDASAPERAQPGDEDPAPAHQRVTRTKRSCGPAASRRPAPAVGRGCPRRRP